MSTITRFAPSPTGSLHLGGARTALFNYIYAKSNNGLFKLRIEDTDKTRHQSNSINSIIDGLNWLNIKYDDKIIFQSKNQKEHLNTANNMITKGIAYRCYHDELEIEKIKKTKKKFQSEWRHKNNNFPKNKKYCIRIKSPESGNTEINDKVQGKVSIQNKEIDDYIIIRSDGSPTFLLSSAVDDHLMSITDIIRGDDHLTNSFRQMLIFKSLNYKPNFSHIPLIHNQNNQKLSKRDNALSILEYKKLGFLPECLINYLLRMGWSHGDKEFFSISEAIKLFRIEKIGKSPSMLDEKKLHFLNNHFIKESSNTDILNTIKSINEGNQNKKFLIDEKLVLNLIEIYKQRANTLLEIIQPILLIFTSKNNYESDQEEILKDSEYLKDTIINEFTSIDDWNEYIITEKIESLLNKFDLNFKRIGQPLRLLITGKINGPSITKIMDLLGKDKVLNKILKNW